MKSGLKVIDAMTKIPVTITPDASIFECASKMKDEKIGSVIVEQKGKITGIITEQDLVYKVVAENMSPKKTQVKDVMTKEVITITPDKDMTEAIMLMSQLNVRRLPVVEHNKILGILTMKDILKIEPQLFDMIVDKIELREEQSKPINRIGDSEGVCELCDNYSDILFEQSGVMVCRNCKE